MFTLTNFARFQRTVFLDCLHSNSKADLLMYLKHTLMKYAILEGILAGC